MNEAKRILALSMKEAAEHLQENIREKRPNPAYGPMVATGRAIDSIEVRLNDSGAQLVSSMPERDFNYIRTLETGRRGEAQDPSMKWPPRQAILDWLITKGIQPRDPDTTIDQLAFLIQRKIGREGTWLARNGAQSGIISEITNPEYIRETITKPMQNALLEHLKRLIVRL